MSTLGFWLRVVALNAALILVVALLALAIFGVDAAFMLLALAFYVIGAP